MKMPIPTIEDFPADRANCGTCTRKGSYCPRNKKNKQQHNGLLYGFGNQVTGIVYRCMNYTGPFKK